MISLCDTTILNGFPVARLLRLPGNLFKSHKLPVVKSFIYHLNFMYDFIYDYFIFPVSALCEHVSIFDIGLCVCGESKSKYSSLRTPHVAMIRLQFKSKCLLRVSTQGDAVFLTCNHEL